MACMHGNYPRKCWASTFGKNEEYKDIADLMLDELLEEVQVCDDFSFSEGIMGLAWGIGYLMEQGFLEQDDDFFCELDDVFSNFEELSKRIYYPESKSMPLSVSSIELCCSSMIKYSGSVTRCIFLLLSCM
jgi:hypothetical protein